MTRDVLDRDYGIGRRAPPSSFGRERATVTIDAADLRILDGIVARIKRSLIDGSLAGAMEGVAFLEAFLNEQDHAAEEAANETHNRRVRGAA